MFLFSLTDNNKTCWTDFHSLSASTYSLDWSTCSSSSSDISASGAVCICGPSGLNVSPSCHVIETLLRLSISPDDAEDAGKNPNDDRRLLF